MISPQEAIFRLRDGNRRYVTTLSSPDIHLTLTRRIELAAEQQPFAVVLGCSDSRVPIELIFDQSIGDLFVIRVAGNIASPTQIGSIEYAVEQLGTRLIVVLGHTGCGAVQATLAEIQSPGGIRSEHLMGIVEHVRPAFESFPDQIFRSDTSDLIRMAVRENVRSSVRTIQETSPSIAHMIKETGLRIAGAEYALESGVVDFFDGLSPSRQSR